MKTAKYCPTCGAENVDWAVFCVNCGKNIPELRNDNMLQNQNKTSIKMPVKPEIPPIQKGLVSRINHPEILGVISALFCVIGAFLPWVSLGSILNMNGIQREGMFTFIISILTIGIIYLGILKRKRRSASIGMIIFGVVIALSAFADTKSILSDQYVQVGNGLYLTFIGGFGLIFSGIWSFVSKESKEERLNIKIIILKAIWYYLAGSFLFASISIIYYLSLFDPRSTSISDVIMGCMLILFFLIIEIGILIVIKHYEKKIDAHKGSSIRETNYKEEDSKQWLTKQPQQVEKAEPLKLNIKKKTKIGFRGFRHKKEPAQKILGELESQDKFEMPVKKPIQEDEAIKILNLRYAKGEINQEEYLKMKKDIVN